MMTFQRLSFASLCLLLAIANHSHAADGDPVAVRRWPGGAMSVETHWGLHLVVDPTEQTEKMLPQKPDQVVRTTDKISHELYRGPNSKKTTWIAQATKTNSGPHAVSVSSVNSPNDQPLALVISVDGISIAVVPDATLTNPDRLDSVKLAQGKIDLLILSPKASITLTNRNVATFVTKTQPQQLLLNISGKLTDDAIVELQKNIGAQQKIRVTNHNTLALQKPRQAKKSELTATPAKVQIVTLTDKPWQMPEDLSKLFVAMEKSSSDSQKVFAKLTVDQMNFKPSNGTHTPRWNTEHMMGRQLLFFSQIYNKIDPTIPVMDLNPKQMPPDYRFANPTWDGKEEARQMQRVSDFTRRFAYLLDGLDVNKRAPGSRWPSLRALLVQMYRHYTEHTANTVKKFSLPDFPKH